jgi:hypothetical protein
MMIKEKRIIIIANIINIIAWPLGFFVASLNSEGTDAAGRGYAEFLALAFVILIVYIPTSIIIIRTGYRNWQELSWQYRIFTLIPGLIFSGILTMIIYISLD